jgi:hypothetical protein
MLVDAEDFRNDAYAGDLRGGAQRAAADRTRAGRAAR